MTWVYFVLSALISVVMVVAQRTSLPAYYAFFLIFTAFLLLTVLLMETGNSLVNPEEGLVLAHQPVNGATYTAAKLTHLARIVLYLTTGDERCPGVSGSHFERSRLVLSALPPGCCARGGTPSPPCYAARCTVG